jgi:hypothetical protein
LTVDPKLKRELAREEWHKKWVGGELPGWLRHHDTHYSTMLLGFRLDYWPGPKKWRWKKKTSFGDVMKFIDAKNKEAK